jgi:hypothetical protein
MDMPQPTDAHRSLARLAGQWAGEEKMFPSDWDPQGGVAIGRTTARVALAEFAVVADYEQQRDGQTTFTGHGVWTVDPRDQENDCALYWFDSIGMGLEIFRGGWDGEVLTVRSRNPMGHARLTYDFSESGVIRSRMEMSPDGEQWKPLFEGEYRRED